MLEISGFSFEINIIAVNIGIGIEIGRSKVMI